MSISVADALSGIRFIHGAVSKEDNREEFQRLAARLEHVVLALEDSKQRDLVQAQEYIDALTTISDLVERSQRILQRLLKRSLGDHTWNRDEIGAEITRISQDVQNYLSVHTIQTLDTMQAINNQQLPMLSSSVEEIMVKLAEIDIRLRTPRGAPWSTGINVEASQATQMVQPQVPDTQNIPIGDGARAELFQNLAAAARTTVKVTGLKSGKSARPDQVLSIPNVKANANVWDILHAIEAMGYVAPKDLKEEGLSITVTESVCEFDATAPGGLQIARFTPLIHWWNKYTAYHGLSPATTPSHTIATVEDDGQTITTAGVRLRFHRTLRVPDTKQVHDGLSPTTTSSHTIATIEDDGQTTTTAGVRLRFHRTLHVPDTKQVHDLPPNLGRFPLLPVSRFVHRLPSKVCSKGGFIMPMFQREALWMSFTVQSSGFDYPAIKVSVGGVNAISGAAKDTPSPPDIDQDYVVAGSQPWLDGIMTESGVVRQVVAMPLGKGYTFEEQVTGKAEHGGLQLDVFPRRRRPNGVFTVPATSQFEYGAPVHNTPAELALSEGSRILFTPRWPKIRILRSSRHKWTLSGYRRRVNPSGELHAYYSQDHGYLPVPLLYAPTDRKEGHNNDVGIKSSEVLSDEHDGFELNEFLGLGARGKIAQKIYRDPVSPRMYDEENGYRVHVHILSTRAWELVTGVLPPITPITPSTYKKYNLSWLSLYDENVPGITAASSPLNQVQSIAQMDEARYSSSADLINPDDAYCSKHSLTRATCVFRPCSHLACAACLGETIMKRSSCAKCGVSVTKFVGMKNPVPRVTAVDDAEEDGTAEDISEIEHLALEAANTTENVTIIHLPGDRVSELYSRQEEPETPPVSRYR